MNTHKHVTIFIYPVSTCVKLTVADYSKKADDEKKRHSKLTEDQRAAVNQLELSWDLPILTATNHTFLQSLFQHAIFFTFIKKELYCGRIFIRQC